METNNQRIQENIKKNHRRDTWLKIVDHLNPSDLWDMMQKFLWQEGPKKFWNSRFYNEKKALELANSSVLCLRKSVKDSVVFHSENDPGSRGGFSGLIMPKNVYMTYDTFLPQQDVYNKGSDGDGDGDGIDLIWKMISISGGIDNIFGFMQPGTFDKTYTHDDYKLSELGVGIVTNGEIKILREFMFEPSNDPRIRNKLDDKLTNEIYGGIIFYKNGTTGIVKLDKLKSLIESKTVDNKIKYIIEPNFLITREPGKDGYMKTKEIIDQVDEWRNTNHINLSLQFNTKNGMRFGVANFVGFPFQKASEIIEELAISIRATSWTAMFGEYRSGEIILLNNKNNRSLSDYHNTPHIDPWILVPNDFEVSLGFYIPRDYFIFKYR